MHRRLGTPGSGASVSPHSMSASPQRTALLSKVPKARAQLGGLMGLLLCATLSIVILSLLHGLSTESNSAINGWRSRNYDALRMSFHRREASMSSSRYAFQAAYTLRALEEGGDTTDALQNVEEVKAESVSAGSPAPLGRYRHHSRVFPRPNDEPIDSVLVVSFDLFPSVVGLDGEAEEKNTSKIDEMDDPSVRELKDVVHSVVFSDTADDATKQRVVYDAAVWLVGRALLSRPSGAFRQPQDLSGVAYQSFFSWRRATSWSYASTQSAVSAPRGAHSTTLNVEQTTVPSASRCPVVVDERFPPGSPVQVDVVYTQVTDDARSQRNFRLMFPSIFRGFSKRFRDWDELKFSARSVFHRTMCGHPNSLCFTPHGGGHASHLVRNIYIVVADADQVPSYLNLSHPNIRVVEHAVLFGQSGEEGTLPTFNSHAIESVLHRIPGLSRFYVYFNNDMMWGRSVSFFDYFRPLAEERQRARIALIEAEVASCQSPDRELGDLQQTYKTQGDSIRVTMMFEPIIYNENIENGADFILVPNASCENNSLVPPLNSTTGPIVSESPPRRQVRDGLENLTTRSNSSGSGRNATMSSPVERTVDEGAAAALRGPAAGTRASNEGNRELRFEDFKALFRLANGRRAQVTSELFRSFISNNKNYALEKLGVAGWPSHSYSHIPHLYDRNIMREMLDVDFKRAAMATRRTRERRVTSLWTTLLASTYHTMHRKVLDWELLEGVRLATARATVQSITVNNRSGTVETRHHPRASSEVSYVTFPNVSSHICNNSTVDDVLPRYWLDGRRNERFGLDSHQFTSDMWGAVSRLARLRSPPEHERASGMRRQYFTDSHGVALLSVISSSADRQHQLCDLVRGNQTLPLALFLSSMKPPGKRDEHQGNIFSSDALQDYAIAEDCARAQQHKNKDGSHWSITEMEKLDQHVVKLDQKSGMYHFCMMNSIRSVRHYTEELKRETKLFVTANDDFPVRLPADAEGAVRELLTTATGRLPSADWEIWWKLQKDDLSGVEGGGPSS